MTPDRVPMDPASLKTAPVGRVTTNRADLADRASKGRGADRADRADLRLADRAGLAGLADRRGMGVTSVVTSRGPHGAKDPRRGAPVSRRGRAGVDRYRHPEGSGTVAP
jgi:hypothetical protein